MLPSFFLQRLTGGVEGGMMALNGTAGPQGVEDYQQWMEGKVTQGKASLQGQRPGGDVYSNTLPVRKVAPAKSKSSLSKHTCALHVNSFGKRRDGRTVLIRQQQPGERL